MRLLFWILKKGNVTWGKKGWQKCFRQKKKKERKQHNVMCEHKLFHSGKKKGM